jgi:uncharacterized protein (DUF488 family)
VASATVFTFGHGTLNAEEFLRLLAGPGIDGVVDIRSFPGSRRNPQYGRQEMEQWVPAGGLGYRWIEALGGRRRPVPGSKHVALRNGAFRAYADHMQTPIFKDGLDELTDLVADAPVAVMCSESVWWRCHRRLLADHLVLVDGLEVVHIMHDGRVVPHAATDGVRLSNGALVYDVGVPLPLAPD